MNDAHVDRWQLKISEIPMGWKTNGVPQLIRQSVKASALLVKTPNRRFRRRHWDRSLIGQTRLCKSERASMLNPRYSSKVLYVSLCRRNHTCVDVGWPHTLRSREAQQLLIGLVTDRQETLNDHEENVQHIVMTTGRYLRIRSARSRCFDHMWCMLGCTSIRF